MFDYQNRFIAALRSRGADEDLIRSAVQELTPFPEDSLVSEFGEPEAYAAELVPTRSRKPRVGLIMAGLVLAVVIAIGLPVMSEAGLPGVQRVAPFTPALALGALAAGIMAEFFRHLASGRP